MPAQRTRDTPLEVSVDSPPTQQPPALSIIAPTPRAFTFPSSHNLADSPFSSPSNSPFEADLRHSFASSSIRPHSPDSMTIPTPPPTHKRRKSSSDVERRPKKGDEDYIKRPENAFILFRRKCVEDREAAAAIADEPPKKQRQADLSKQISQQWKSLSPEERQYWEGLAKEKKREHEQMYPDYVYRPQRTKRTSTKGKKRGTYDDVQDSHHFVLPVPAIRQHGRSASAPTPPPYQAFNIPNVFAGTGSCPTSPSLLPLIARRASHEDPLATFDYIPRETLMPPPMFPPTYDSNELLRTMYAHQRGEGLPPLTLPHELLQPGQVMCSPASSVASTSSGPSSPNSVPYTPTSGLLSHEYAQMSHMDSNTCEAIAQADLHEQQLYQQGDLDLAGYSWDANSIWGTSDLLIADDFDINSIPPIELDIPKLFEGHPVYGGHTEYSQNGQYSHLSSSQQASMVGAQLAGFDEMMAGKHY